LYSLPSVCGLEGKDMSTAEFYKNQATAHWGRLQRCEKALQDRINQVERMVPVIEAAIEELDICEQISQNSERQRPKLYLTQEEDEKLMEARMKLHAAVRAYKEDV